MPKILYVATPPYDLDPNSYNVQGIGLGKAFCRLGYDFDCIRFKKKNPHEWKLYEHQGCSLNYIEKERLRLFRWGLNSSLLKKDFLDGYDYVIVREYYQIMADLIARRHPAVYLYSGHYYDPFMFPFTSPLYDALFTKDMNSHLRATFVKSPLAKQFLQGKGYERVFDIGVGLDTERFDTVSLPDAGTKELMEFMTRNRCVLFVGNLSEVKNYRFLLQLFQELLERFPDLKLVAIGKSKQSAIEKLKGHPDESYAKTIENDFPDSVIKAIHHIERVENPQLKFIYPLAKAFILPSVSEIFGMVLLEAMYLGAPVVTSTHGGSTSLLSIPGAGAMLPSFDVREWADATSKFIEDEKFASDTVSEARRRIVQDFTWDSIAKKMLDVIKATVI